MLKPLGLSLTLLLSTSLFAQAPAPSKEVQTASARSHKLYVDLHEHPELSSHETQTAAKLAASLRSLGYDVTEHVGGTGIVAVMKNGEGPTILLRTELDALPVPEKTGVALRQQGRRQGRQRQGSSGDARLRARRTHGIDRGHSPGHG